MHKETCDDWDTAATYYRREKAIGASAALKDYGKIAARPFGAYLLRHIVIEAQTAGTHAPDDPSNPSRSIL